MNDHRRDAANRAVVQFLDSFTSNTISAGLIWKAVNAAMDAYEDELCRDLIADGTVRAWAITRDGKPLLVLPSKRMARQQRRLLATLAQEPARRWQIVATEVAFPAVRAAAAIL